MIETINRRNTIHDYSEYVVFLPETEQTLIMYMSQDMPQKEIARIMGVTQGAVSSRLKRAIQRLTFLKELKKFNFDNFEQDLQPIFSNLEIALLKSMTETTCQSETARILNNTFNNGMTQVKVRYRFEKCIIYLKGLCEALNYQSQVRDKFGAVLKDSTGKPDIALDAKKYLKYYKLFTLVKANLYKLHEVKLPHFGG